MEKRPRRLIAIAIYVALLLGAVFGFPGEEHILTGPAPIAEPYRALLNLGWIVWQVFAHPLVTFGLVGFGIGTWLLPGVRSFLSRR